MKRYLNGDVLNARDYNKVLDTIDTLEIETQKLKNGEYLDIATPDDIESVIGNSVSEESAGKLLDISCLQVYNQYAVPVSLSFRMKLKGGNRHPSFANEMLGIGDDYLCSLYNQILESPYDAKNASLNVQRNLSVYVDGFGTFPTMKLTNVAMPDNNMDIIFDNEYTESEMAKMIDAPDIFGLRLLRTPVVVDGEQCYWAVVTKDGKIYEPGNYPNPSPQTFEVTFVDFNGNVLAKQSVISGNIPVYDGIEPTREDKYDANTNFGTEYTFAGWTPKLDAVSGDTTYTASYSERQFSYVQEKSYVREKQSEINENKKYLFVAPDGTQKIAVNGTWNGGSRYFSVLSGDVQMNEGFENLKEFKIENATPTTFFKITPVTSSGNYHIMDLSDNGYLVAAGSDAFANKITNETSLDSSSEWIINTLTEIKSVTQKTRGIKYRGNSNPPRFATPTGYTDVNLFYEKITEKKVYANGYNASSEINTDNKIPTFQNISELIQS